MIPTLKNGCKTGYYFFFIVCFGIERANSQSIDKPIYDFSKLRDFPEVDSSMDIRGLNESDYNKLIEKMFIADQKYREIHFKEGRKSKPTSYPKVTDPKMIRIHRPWKINDSANQALFLRLLKFYKWPKQVGKNGSSVKAWHIAWHAPPHIKKQFYPFMIEAVNNKVLGSKTLAPFQAKMNEPF